MRTNVSAANSRFPAVAGFEFVSNRKKYSFKFSDLDFPAKMTAKKLVASRSKLRTLRGCSPELFIGIFGRIEIFTTRRNANIRVAILRTVSGVDFKANFVRFIHENQT